ncbi:MAG: hypothetical protein LC128_12135 [Chitinophagales bacterium]|nr:hypothetical protein [Chitinophagales bacterium]
MKKILLALDGGRFSKGACEFAKALNEKSPILLVGAFLPQVDYANLWSYSSGGLTGPLFIPVAEGEDSDSVRKNEEQFGNFCRKNNIEFRVHKDYYDFALPELRKETRFADLLLLSGELFYQGLGSKEPNDYLKDALHGVECPVVVVPEEYEFPNSNVLTYDGSEDSVFAIKQFAYLFPELKDNKTILVYVNKKGEKRLPEEVSIGELAARHFKDLTMMHLKTDSGQDFNAWLEENKGAILVSGAFGRSAFSRAFKKSFITDAIKEQKLPIFIAHN